MSFQLVRMDVVPNVRNEFPADRDGAFSFYHEMVEDFVNAVIEGKPAPISGADGLKCLWVVLAVYQAGREGRIVELVAG